MLLVILSCLILIGVILMTIIVTNLGNRQLIRIDIGDPGDDVVEFENLGMIPGQRCHYVLSFESVNAQQHHIKLTFAEKDDQTLKKYAYAKITMGDQVVYEDLLENLFKKKELEFDVELVNGQSRDVEIAYYLPESVGNEAQNAETTFDLLITTNNK